MGWPSCDLGDVGMSARDPREVAQDWAERTCREQRMPGKVTDRASVGEIVVLLGQKRQTGATRRSSKVVRPGTAEPMTKRSSRAATIER